MKSIWVNRVHRFNSSIDSAHKTIWRNLDYLIGLSNSSALNCRANFHRQTIWYLINRTPRNGNYVRYRNIVSEFWWWKANNSERRREDSLLYAKITKGWERLRIVSLDVITSRIEISLWFSSEALINKLVLLLCSKPPFCKIELNTA
jgi:hypothetical protein